jgi:TMEM175 potassium channel family protein
MSKTRLEAFSDGVIAIIITIMVLELRPPHDATWSALQPMIPAALSYVLSFVFIGIYWHNHHHLFQAVHRVNGRILWANSHLLFWISLIPFATAWMGENHFAAVPVAAYGIVLVCAAVAYYILAHVLISHHGRDSTLAKAFGRDWKGKLSIAICAAAIPLSFVSSAVACGLYVLIAVIWLIPDRRIERIMSE